MPRLGGCGTLILALKGATARLDTLHRARPRLRPIVIVLAVDLDGRKARRQRVARRDAGRRDRVDRAVEILGFARAHVCGRERQPHVAVVDQVNRPSCSASRAAVRCRSSELDANMINARARVRGLRLRQSPCRNRPTEPAISQICRGNIPCRKNALVQARGHDGSVAISDPLRSQIDTDTFRFFVCLPCSLRMHHRSSSFARDFFCHPHRVIFTREVQSPHAIK
jgi:hypothetical protein